MPISKSKWPLRNSDHANSFQLPKLQISMAIQITVGLVFAYGEIAKALRSCPFPA
jgi:hypothetical protein